MKLRNQWPRAVEQSIAGSPLTTGNRIELLQDGRDSYRAMIEAIEGAGVQVNLIQDSDTLGIWRQRPCHDRDKERLARLWEYQL